MNANIYFKFRVDDKIVVQTFIRSVMGVISAGYLPNGSKEPIYCVRFSNGVSLDIEESRMSLIRDPNDIMKEIV